MATRQKFSIAHTLVAIMAIVLLYATRAIPFPRLRRVGALLGRTALRLFPRMRKVGLANLDLAYGNSLTRAEKERILAAAAENVGIVMAEFSHLPWLRHHRYVDRFDQIGREYVDWARPALFISAHLGNWECIMPAVSAAGTPIAEVVRPLDHPWLNAVVDGLRRGGGIHTIPKQRAGAEIQRLLQQGHYVGVLVDQSPRDRAVPVTFFGRPCWATIAPVMIALRADVPLHPVSLTRNADGGYTLRFWPAIDLVRNADFHEGLVANSQRVQNVIEGMVREYPGQWLWFHRRWKRRDRLESAWAEKHASDSADDAG